MVIEGTSLNIVKAIYDKPTENIILNGEKLKAFPLRSPLSTIIQHSSGSHSYINREEKEIKGI